MGRYRSCEAMACSARKRRAHDVSIASACFRNPLPPVSFHSLCIRVCFPCGCLLVSVVGRSILGLVFRGVCARGERRCKCQSRPPTGDVPLLLPVHQAAGPRALCHPSCLMIRRSFPQPTLDQNPKATPTSNMLLSYIFLYLLFVIILYKRLES